MALLSRAAVRQMGSPGCHFAEDVAVCGRPVRSHCWGFAWRLKCGDYFKSPGCPGLTTHYDDHFVAQPFYGISGE